MLSVAQDATDNGENMQMRATHKLPAGKCFSLGAHCERERARDAGVRGHATLWLMQEVHSCRGVSINFQDAVA